MIKTTSAELLPLLEGCARSDRKSQENLYRLFYSFAMGVCLRYCRNREEALEALNDGFLKVFNNISHFQPEKHEPVPSFVGYLKKILIHTAIDQYRSTIRTSQTVELEEHLVPAQDHTESPLDGLAYEDLIGLIRQLSPAYRAVFNLYAIDGYSHEEIARQLDISVGTSKSNLAKARLNLRELLKRSHEERYSKYA
ncbi:RNA polymerase sigma factor [Siphonobacter aquaeclarae]|uniref:RNA polymerase sigma-70 factor, ECF subfamily n=1 Tax=Siphonobacter aquaeclarae TaxID=563176 RepID=A0A1G9QCX2_9BACT|nr:sigma-70 family RNA polymerase sigma factor [Siphonobacter aquaeclarae]MBO9639681.1 sigma-70 family RNA polymerase sigma factor [Siphonobacter aquaeclarae]SDM08866.1 RNA polymerase sigma-70 factor, ECF subfamily [Siphonobacter aquaeclarae]